MLALLLRFLPSSLVCQVFAAIKIGALVPTVFASIAAIQLASRIRDKNLTPSQETNEAKVVPATVRAVGPILYRATAGLCHSLVTAGRDLDHPNDAGATLIRVIETIRYSRPVHAPAACRASQCADK
jgi:hypothetical protein